MKVVAMSEELSNVLPYDCMVYLKKFGTHVVQSPY